ncbi:hypothetical protein [Streptomyces sp. CHB9.2]|uniref:hypothetical protein n=1 Tax=Streptomyces sp. CHB9.2 TaxID=2841670 RepID=UPI002096119E|nr:hypothetical protein [Streptomyces sp. CHB9.2]MCO6704693.1 hypothetical protein [Streptomyces sp. CHB9.2]
MLKALSVLVDFVPVKERIVSRFELTVQMYDARILREDAAGLSRFTLATVVSRASFFKTHCGTDDVNTVSYLAVYVTHYEHIHMSCICSAQCLMNANADS